MATFHQININNEVISIPESFFSFLPFPLCSLNTASRSLGFATWMARNWMWWSTLLGLKLIKIMCWVFRLHLEKVILFNKSFKSISKCGAVFWRDYINEKPSLPNQEKNPYWTIYWQKGETQVIVLTNEGNQQHSKQELSGLLRSGSSHW